MSPASLGLPPADVAAWCRSFGAFNTVFDGSVGCRSNDTVTVFDPDAACQWQFQNPSAKSQSANGADLYAWVCSVNGAAPVPGTASSGTPPGVSRSGSTPAPGGPPQPPPPGWPNPYQF